MLMAVALVLTTQLLTEPISSPTVPSPAMSGKTTVQASPNPRPTTVQASPNPRPTIYNDDACCGEFYIVPGNVLFFDFSRPKNASISVETGYLSQYLVQDEKTTNHPVATVMLVTRPNADGMGSVLAISFPLMINGKQTSCPDNHSSRFAQKYGVCQSLPASIMGPSHPVAVQLYSIQYPDGSHWYATDTIDVINKPSP